MTLFQTTHWVQKGETLSLTSDVFAADVCLDLCGTETYGDDFFNLYPGEPYEVAVPEGFAPESIRCGEAFKPECCG